MSRIISLTLLIVSLSFIIFFHEFGHFAMCKLFDVATPVFSLGFGPAVVQKQIGQTTFQIALLPLGGYVSMNQHDLDQKAYWQKMLIILAGIINNIILGFVLLVFVYLHNRNRLTPTVTTIEPNSPAAKSGLKAHDRIIQINELEVGNNADALIKHIQHYPDDSITLTVERNGQQLIMPVALTSQPLFGIKTGYLGATFEHATAKTTFLCEVKRAGSMVYELLKDNFLMLINVMSFKSKKLFRKLLTSIHMGHQTTARAVDLFLLMTAVSSVQIGFFNLLPIPLLDGGQVVHYTVQAVMGRPLTRTELNIFYLLLMSMLLFFALRTKKRTRH